MHVISKIPFAEAADKYPNCTNAILDTYKTLAKSRPKNLHELQQMFPSAERFKYIDDAYVVNIAGNHIRLIAVIYFKWQKMFVKHVVSHSEYDKLNARYRKGELP